jgi:hypothetical protein
MENPIDNVIDMGLVNYVAHPENKKYVVFRFADEGRANSFEKLLVQEAIWFEKGEEEKRGRNFVLFGLKNRDFKKAEKFNYIVEAEHKKPIIPFKALRWTLLVFTGIVMTITLLGYCHTQKVLEQSNKPTDQSKGN